MDIRKFKSRIDPPRIIFGVVTLTIGIVTGCLMYAHPEGLNPEWPLWMALVAPVVFAAGGLLLLSGGLGFPRFTAAMLSALVICLMLIANWAAFFTTGFEAVMTISFLGVPLAEKYLSETAGQTSLRLIMAAVDALTVLFLAALAYGKARKRSS